MICMEEVIGSRIGAKRFTPIVVNSEKATFIDDGESICRIYIHHIHHPHFKVLESRGKPALA